MSRTGENARRIGLQASFLLGAVLVSALVVLIAGRDPLAALSALAAGAFGSVYGFLNVWTKACPLLIVGLAIVVAFRAGFWNIGAEGQFMAGAIVAGWLGTWGGLAPGVHHAIVLIVAAAAGAFWCSLAAWLRIRRGALEVISTIMLNFVALFLLSWLVHGPLQQSSGAQPIGDPVLDSARLPRIAGAAYPMHAGILFALVVVAFGHWGLARTRTGFALDMVGRNPRAAAWAGIRVDRTMFVAALWSGGLAGVAGAIEILGVLGRIFDKVSPGYGFTAIAVALLARLQPWALIPAALFFGALESGASRMQQDADVSHVLVLVIQAVVILASIGSGVVLARRYDS